MRMLAVLMRMLAVLFRMLAVVSYAYVGCCFLCLCCFLCVWYQIIQVQVSIAHICHNWRLELLVRLKDDGMMYCTAWPNASYSEKMPGHIDPYWVIVWTLPITSIPKTKCSTWKLGQNGLIWPFFRSFWLFYGIWAFFWFDRFIFLQYWCQ